MPGASDVVPPDAATDLVARAVRYAVTLRKVEAGLRRYQAFDELTGLLNARGFDLLANHHFRLADRSKDPVLIVFLRVDEDGGAPGEAAVADAATVISSAVRVSDVVARVGSEAFCVLLAGAVPGSEPIVLERIIEAVATHNASTGHETGPSVSIGAAVLRPRASGPARGADRRGRPPHAAPLARCLGTAGHMRTSRPDRVPRSEHDRAANARRGTDGTERRLPLRSSRRSVPARRGRCP